LQENILVKVLYLYLIWLTNLNVIIYSFILHMEAHKAFQNIEAIKIESTADKIIRQLRNLISTGQLKPGDRLPAERVLAERFGVGRGYIREAILKLEFYGLLKTSPQSGTYVSGFSLKILDSIFSDIVNFNKEDFASLIEARYHLEINSARLAAERRTADDIEQMSKALKEYDSKFVKGEIAVDEDLLFHIKIASATKNTVIESMILILVPDLIKIINLIDRGESRNKKYAVVQHHKVLDAIIDRDGDAAGEAMAEHLKEIMEIRFTFKQI
jgi:GntR family transcriptional regulator, transcriptional repressor for pyruvate dehydrogenase complex